MSNLSSLLMGEISLKNKTQGGGINQNNSEENLENKNDSLNASSENVKIKVVNMQEYKTKKYLEERKNMKVWDNSGNKKEKKGKKEKKEKKEEAQNGKTSETKKDNKTENIKKDTTEKTTTEEVKTEKKLYRPPIKTILAKEKEKEKLAAENEEEDMFPDLAKAINVAKGDKKKNQPVKKSKKDKKKKPTEEEKEKEAQKRDGDEQKDIEKEQEIKKIEKINFNIFDIIDIKRQYEPISRNIEKVALKYENRQKYKELVGCS